MPLLPNSAYCPPVGLRNGHLQTVYPVLLRRVTLPAPVQRERIVTPDGDFLDLEWLRQARPKDTSGKATLPLAILTHGLEGNCAQGYMRGMMRALYLHGWDVLSWNMRGCGTDPNLCLRSYHSGATDDLHTVICHVAGAAGGTTSIETTNSADSNADADDTATATGEPQRIALIGFSLGGNIVLKYAGELSAHAGHAPPSDAETSAAADHASPASRIVHASPASRVTHAIGISVPCDLAGSTEVLEHWSRRIYMERFLRTLRRKIRLKQQQFPRQINTDGLDAIRTFRQFDDRYTAPLHGFKDAQEYWYKCSCLRSLGSVPIPTLLLNAADDPFLSQGCYPRDLASDHPLLHLEIPQHGGHVGFVRTGRNAPYYSEERVIAFLQQTPA